MRRDDAASWGRRLGLVWRTLALSMVLAACVPVPARDEAMSTSRAGAASAALTDTANQLVSRRVARAPGLGPALDPAWEQAQPLHVPLTWGSHGTDRAGEVELRALYTEDELYLLARWPEAAPAQTRPDPAKTTENKLTVHWSIVQTGEALPDCDVACHTAHTDGAGRLAYLNAETIPPGSQPALRSAGGWRDGAWTLVWGRPLVNSNPYDLQFDDLGRRYPFFVKLFLGQEGRADPVSALYELVFAR